ncbi:MAG TPA: FtsQ-type POTRA domain-containing protein [Candidatus Saccharimonadales bacterium]|nr:FtsQ-type POTRA domain-containing protein [Candidatus Saccharimonadales bacterium]
MTRRSVRPRRRNAGHVRRAGPALRTRLGRVLPTAGRLFALLLCAALSAGLVLLANGPWLRVERVAWAGQHYTAASELQHALDRLRGRQLLTLDLSAVRAEIEKLPAVSGARVEALLPDQIQITLAEKQATFVWQTSAARLIGAADGTLIGQIPLPADLPKDLAALPLVDDRRVASRAIAVGDRIDPALLAAALRLARLDPARLGSAATHLAVRLDDEHGFLLVANDPGWQAALGLYGVDLADDPPHAWDRIEAQLAAIRTLFSMRPETGVSWVDVRNPGRVYWRP